MENEMETRGLQGCIGIQIAQCTTLMMENQMEKQMENEMETLIWGLGLG